MSVEDAAGWANATAGQAVVFAGLTVVVAILGLQLSGLPAVTAMGYACAIVVLVSVLVAVTLLPAFLGFAGHKIDRLKVPGHPASDRPNGTTASGRWARHVGHHPWRYVARQPGACSASSPSRSPACGWASPTTRTSSRRPPSARPTTCSPTASAPASTARSPSSSTARPRTSIATVTATLEADDRHRLGAAADRSTPTATSPS